MSMASDGSEPPAYKMYSNVTWKGRKDLVEHELYQMYLLYIEYMVDYLSCPPLLSPDPDLVTP